MMFAKPFVSFAFLAGTISAMAGVVTNSPNLPPNAGAYVSPAAVHACYPTCPNIDLNNISHSFFTNIVRTPSGANEIETFNSIATGLVSVSGGAFQPITLAGPVQTMVFNKIGNVTGTFNTEMLALNLSGGGVMIRESPTLQSTGQTTIADLGGGNFRIDSFFDIFTELSLDGGATWIPSNGPTHVDLVPGPEPAAGLLVGAMLAALVLYRCRLHFSR